MARPGFILLFLLAAGFTLATCIQLHETARPVSGAKADDVMAVFLGDTRKLIANELFAKADTYFHKGVYPSIFDARSQSEENHMVEEASGGTHDAHEHEAEHDHESSSGGWIARFGKHFNPTQHIELSGGTEREILPWLQFSAEMDPHHLESYLVTSYWLRRKLGKVDEAEKFLYQGLRANPGQTELLCELGRLFYEDRHDLGRARNIWLGALRRWNEVEKPKDKPDMLLLEQILGGLALVEEQMGHYDAAIQFSEQWKAVSPSPEGIQKRIDELKLRQEKGRNAPR